MNYPINCDKCTQALYGPVKYCPFCGAAFVSGTVPSEKQKLDSLRVVIDDSLAKGEFTPDIRGYVKKKGQEVGIVEEVCNSFLLEALTDKGFIPEKENPHDPLSVCWYSAEKKKNIAKTEQKPETIKKEPPKEEKREEVKQPAPTPPEPPEIPFAPPPPPKADKSRVGTPETKKPEPPPPKPLFWKVVMILGIVVIIGGFFYAKKGSLITPGSKQEQGETKTQPTPEQPKETVKEVGEPSKPQTEQGGSQQPAPVPNLNEEREKMRQEAEREALAKVEAEKQRQEQINRQREIENQRREQAVKQQEVDSYLSDGKRLFENGKYELCIEKMREVIKRDNSNPEAKQYLRMASERISNIKNKFKNPTFGGAE